MATLQDYLQVETLRQLAAMFSAAAGVAVRIAAPDGSLLAGPAAEAGPVQRRAARAGPANRGVSRLWSPPRAQAKLLVAGEHIATLVLAGQVGRPDAEAVRLLGLMRDVLTRLCEQGAQLRDRLEELATIYRVTEVFSGRTDLKEVHRLVARTMVKVTGSDACSIRVLSEDGAELLTMAAYGLSDSYMSKGRILLKDSKVDQEALSGGQTVYIADERTDPRILYKAEARSEGLVSALCVPMSYRGRTEGVIRVYTRRPHEFDWFERSLIKGIASQAASAIANTRLYHEALQAETIRRQMRMAGEVQRRMIPARPPTVAGLEIATVFEPCYEVGGDFYDFIQLPGGNLGLAVADVAGKGVQASLVMASARSALRAYAGRIYELSEVLAALNLHLWRDGGGGDFVTLFYGVLDVPNRRLTYCNAGHEPGILVRDGTVRELTNAGGVLGIDPAMAYWHEGTALRAGDVLLVYTDGLVEAANFRDELFGRRRVHAAALDAWSRGESAEGIGKHLLWEMRRFSGLQTRADDLTLVTIRVQ